MLARLSIRDIVLIDAVDLFATLTLGGPVADRPGLNDRQTKASDVLAALPASG